MSRGLRFFALVVVGAGLFLLGRLTGTGVDEAPAGRVELAPAALWTCPMHPQIRLPDPVPCPLCGMDLVPVDGSGAGGGAARELQMTPEAVALAHVETIEARREAVVRPVRLVGKVDYDETAVRTISAWVPGRLDRLFVDYTGVRVEAGDHLVRLYSPELFTAQEELLAAFGRREATGSEASTFLAESNRRAYEAAREKLRLYGLTEEQVAEIEARGSAEEHVMLTSPTSGVVMQKHLEQGAYVDVGTPVYGVADLTHLWVLLDAYEQDLPWLRYGQEVTIEAEARPGELLEGRISFIDPVVHEATRTTRVRVNVDNRDGWLKPGMFVRATVRAWLGRGGEVEARDLSGKWVSPMHPEVVKDRAGDCDVCGMELVPAEELGLVSSGTGELPVVVPASGVLLTGERAVCYVELTDRAQPTYEARELLLGPRAGDRYIVRSGLAEGERVVVHGAFRIDSAMQILARPSMMSMPGEVRDELPPELARLRARLFEPVDAYLGLQVALAADDGAAASAAWTELARAAAGFDADRRRALEILPQDEREELAGALRELAELGAGAGTLELEEQRAAFVAASRASLLLVGALGAPDGVDLRRAHCPMVSTSGVSVGALAVEAVDGGALWLQVEGPVANPYYGAEMLRCGTLARLAPPRVRGDGR